jgi:hypothetical protein
MKKISSLLIVLLIIVFVSNSYSEGLAEPATPVAIVMKVIKDVKLKTAEASNWSGAKIGQQLSTGDEIKTEAKSLAVIKFTDGSIINVRENSSLKIYADKKNKQISKNTYIDKGDVQFNVNKQEAEEFKFTTPTMVASIRGTQGAFNVKEEESMLLCTEGSIFIEALLGSRQTGDITGGQFAKVGTEGNINIGQISPEQMNKIENMKKSNSKKVTIKTNAGNIVIEYLSE